MATHHAPTDPEADAVAVDTAAEALLSVWDTARESASNRVSSSQLRALLVVEAYDGVNLRGLAAQLGVILSSASRLCDRLVAAGLLERVPGRTDRREIALHLTLPGKHLLESLRTARRERLATVLNQMSTAGREALLRGLSEFGAVVDGVHDGPAAATA
jgi:DNA-binding MarR family transcriptional regulator